MKNIFAVSAFAVLAACGAQPQASSLSQTEGLGAGMEGCYRVTRLTVVADAQPSKAALLGKTDRVCIDDTRNNLDMMPKLGAFEVTFRSPELVTRLGYNLAVAQPKCPTCYSLEGRESNLFYREFPGDATINVAFLTDGSRLEIAARRETEGQ